MSLMRASWMFKCLKWTGNSAAVRILLRVPYCVIDHLITCCCDFRFEATRRIRDMETSLNDRVQKGEAPEVHGNVVHWHTPILAMTADVIQATHEHCLQAGMDGYVSKPFEESQLYGEVARFLQSNSSSD